MALSKSRLVAAEQCHKRLWFEVHKPDLRIIAPATQERFNQGHLLGGVAQDVFGPGVLIGHQDDLSSAVVATREALEKPGPVTLFEAAFVHGGVLVRADVLTRDAQGKYGLIEVKSSTSVKDEHHFDVAIQCWVIEGAGIPLTSIELAFINNKFVYQGDSRYEGLISRQPIDKEVRALLPSIPERVKVAQEVVASSEPQIQTGPHCYKPYSCAFYQHCSQDDPVFPVWWIPRISESRLKELFGRGIRDVAAIPKDMEFTDNQQRVVDATLEKRIFVDKDSLQSILALPYPRFYLDFETVSFAVPIWKDTRPYEQLPFQFSCVVESANHDVKTESWLARGQQPPMRAFAEALIRILGEVGPVIVYSGFENTRLKELAGRFTDLAPALEAIRSRLFDLRKPVTAGYYHPNMVGSYSIKDVLPTVTNDLDYSGLSVVTDGTAASAAYIKILNESTSETERKALAKELIHYCNVDAQAMRALCEKLTDLAK